MSLNEIVRSSISRAGVVRVRNALNPLLWLSAVGPTVSWGAAYLLRDDAILRYGFALLGAMPIVGSLTADFVLLFKDPDRLQSEEFILRQQELSLFEHKGGGAPEASIDAETSKGSPQDRSGHQMQLGDRP